MVNFVYFCGNSNWSYEYFCRWHNFEIGLPQGKMRYQNHKQSAEDQPYYSAGDTFYKTVKPGQHYVYIITPEWTDIFERELKRLNMWEYKIYESREFAENYNYPGEARLKVFVFRTPKDFVHKPTGTYDD